MADTEYIKRSDVIGLVEEAIKICSTEKTTKLVCAHLRTAVMGLRSADVAPRAEVAREIFSEIRQCWARRPFECGDFSFRDFAFDDFAGDLDKLCKKYTEEDNQ